MCLKVFKDFCSQRAEKRRVKLTRINKNSCGETTVCQHHINLDAQLQLYRHSWSHIQRQGRLRKQFLVPSGCRLVHWHVVLRQTRRWRLRRLLQVEYALRQFGQYLPGLHQSRCRGGIRRSLLRLPSACSACCLRMMYH